MLLMDADILCYRVGFACNQEDEGTALSTMDSMIGKVLLKYPELPVRLFLTGRGNFRDKIAITAPYKGNRDRDKDRPVHFDALRRHLQDVWGAEVTEGIEADDAIAIAHTLHNYESIIVSLDKDFGQLPGRHYNFVTEVETVVTPFDAMKFLYEQILMGDKSDNIIGIYKVGPVKAAKLLSECKTEHEMYLACVRAYEELDGCLHPVARVTENANLLYLLRKEGDSWKVPLPMM